MEMVSVIIPVYNVENYLSECLESVINQTYKDLEILCINDCSTDGSHIILEEYAQRDPRIGVLENERNSGLAYTRNVGLQKAAGEYILFVDSDDVIALDLVESCMKSGYGNDIVCFDYKQVTKTEAFERQCIYKVRDGLYTGEAYFEELVFTDSIIFTAWSKLIKRKFLIENHILFHNGILYEDILFTFQCLINAKKVYSLNRKLYVYRVRESSIMTNKVSNKNIESYIINICELTELYLKNSFSPQMNHAVEGYIQKVVKEYISTYRKWENKESDTYMLVNKPEYMKLYRTFTTLFIKSGKLSDISTGQIEKMRQYTYVIMYGAGDIARSAIEILDQYDIPLYGIAVSSVKGNPKSLLGNPIKELSEYYDVREKCLVLIATIPRYYSEIRDQLRENGFINWMEIIEVCNDGEDNR